MKKSQRSKKLAGYTIDDLTAFSPWPARLLGLEPWTVRKKDAVEVAREYNCDKWGALLFRIHTSRRKISLGELELWSTEGIPPSLCSIGNRFELRSASEAREEYLKVARNALRNHLPASALVELGAGYGSVILQLALQPEFSGMPIVAGEYTDSGLELIRILAENEGIAATVGRCDLSSPWITNLAIPEGALVFTSMAVHYVPMLSSAYVDGISSLRPKVVVNIEPCYEHFDVTSLTGALRRRYIEVNDYNRNLVSVLHERERDGLVRILEESPAVFGINPLLPVSIITWSPVCR